MNHPTRIPLWRLPVIALICCSLAAAQEAKDDFEAAAKPDKVVAPESVELTGKDEIPSIDAPWLPLRVRDPANKSIAEEAVSFARRLELYSRHLAVQLEKKEIQKINPQELSAAQIANSRLRRAADLLELRREPAGSDLRLHAARNLLVLNNAREACRKLPNFPTAALRQRLEGMIQQAIKEKPAIEQLIAAQEYERAEQQLHRVIDRLTFVSMWLEPVDHTNFLQPFLELLNRFQEKLLQQRRSAVTAQLKEQRKALGEGNSDLPERLQAAEKALAAGTTVRWGDRTLSGPELIDAVLVEWQQLQGQLAQLAVYDALLAESNAARSAVLKRHSDEVVKRLAALIEADAADCAPADAPALHQAYLERLAPLVARSARADLMARLNPALMKVADRDLQLSQRVRAYQVATSDVLRWRAKWAAKQVEVRNGDYRTMSRFLQSLQGDVNAAAGFDSAEGNYLVLRFHPVAVTLQQRAGKVRGTSVRIEKIQPLGSESHQRYAGCFGALPAPSKAAIESEQKRLKTDLLVDDKSPPLSLEAAVAIWTAEQGWWDAVGATVKHAAVEPTNVLLLSRPEILSTAALGEIPKSSSEPLLSLRLSYEQLAWVQHRHFFVLLGP